MSRLDLADGLRLIGQVSKEGQHFGHREHLEFAWLLLDEADDLDDAARLASLTIRHVAQLGGNPDKFHMTVTVFWLRLLVKLRAQHPQASSVDELMLLHPPLGNPQLVDQYWSDLETREARDHWVEPDLRAAP